MVVATEVRDRPCSTFLGQLSAMVRRNVLLKKKSLSIAELLLPTFLLLSFVLLGVVIQTYNTEYQAVSEFETQPFFYPGVQFDGLSTFLVGYVPSNEKVDRLMNDVRDFWMSFNGSVFRKTAFTSPAALEEAYLHKSFLGVGVIFHDPHLDLLNYTLRYPPGYVPGTSRPYIRPDQMPSCRNINLNGTFGPPQTCVSNSYTYAGFSSLQNVISTAYMTMKGYRTMKPLNLSTKLLPDKAKSVAPGGFTVASLPAFYFCNLLGCFVAFLVTTVVSEKEKQYIESMKVMGLRSSVYWISWVSMYALMMLVMSSIAVGLVKVLSIWPNTSSALLLIDCMLFGCSCIAIGFCVAPLFKQPVIAGLVANTLMNVFGFLSLLEVFMPSMTDTTRWGLALLSPTAFFMAMSRVAQAEAEGWGIGFGNAMASRNGDGNIFGNIVGLQRFSYGHASVMICLDLILYSLLAVYLQKVFSNGNTQKQLPWFFILPSYWFPQRTSVPSHIANTVTVLKRDDIEPVPESLRARIAIAIYGLRKVFPGKHEDEVAISDFTYEMYEDEVLAIMGHNGAGKTTLINMITGMVAPTSGTVLVYGNNVANPNELDFARKHIGVCPQQNILFDKFTVREHIEFYARMKGFSDRAAKLEFERIVEEIGMREQADVEAQTLSGGQKRRLSIAIAVVGNPKILILDEPTSGVDPCSRRQLWETIRGFRRGRCVIITTQSMQEADVFADRKLIISQGRLRCAGTSLFLKSRFGLGYHLTLATERDYDEDSITELVKGHVAGAAKTRAHAGELCYLLPKSSMDTFPEFFNKLDDNLVNLNIKSYGVSLPTMEEIFLKLADENEFHRAGMADNWDLQKPRDHSLVASLEPNASEITEKVSGWTKFRALAKVRFLLLLRSKLSFIFQFFIPFLLLMMNGVLSVLSTDYVAKLFAGDSLQIDELIGSFKNTGANFFYQNNSAQNIDSLVRDLSKGGVAFDALNYTDLFANAPRFAGYIVDSVAVHIPAVTICYNASVLHGIPYSTNLLLSSIFRNLTGSNESFHVASHPFPTENVLDTPPGQIFESALVGLAVIMIPGIYGVDMSRDRQMKIRSQIRMTGCSLFLYWGSAFVVHLLQFTASFLMIIVLLYAFGVPALTDATGCLFALFALHGPAVVLFCYCLSFFFSTYQSATVGLPFPLMGIGCVLYFVIFLLNGVGANIAAKVFHYLFSFLFPGYGFFGALIYVQKVFARNQLAYHPGSVQRQSYFDWDSNIPVVLLAHAVQIPLFICLVIYLESRFFNQNWLPSFGVRIAKPSVAKVIDAYPVPEEDNDVLRERMRVNDINPPIDSSSVILLRSLWKRFHIRSFSETIKRKLRWDKSPSSATEEKVAVRNLALTFPRGEIFGLLGPNGAGKTTAISMIIGEITPSSGDIHVNGFNTHTEILAALRTMGCCVQTDTLWDDITMKEHLELFATLNDIPKNRCCDSIASFAARLHISEHLQKRASALSGGTKRKLTLAMSMIGRNTPMMLLDEPSTGMDPRSKRHLWDLIVTNFTGERGAVLTTHSMEEADALCDRIGIIVKGELRCIGTAQHLKNKFGSGYMLEIKLPTPINSMAQNEKDLAAASVKEAIKKLLPGSEFVENFHNCLSFTVPKQQMPAFGIVFAGLDRVKREHNLEEYSFGQTTIEQVFLHFAKMQDIQEEHEPAGNSHASIDV